MTMKADRQPTGNERRLLELLGVGRETARPASELAELMGIDKRTLRHLIRSLVERYKVPVIGVRMGERRGYFIAGTIEELIDGARTFYSQIRQEQKRLDALMSSDLNSWKQLREGAER